jgi:hypothetical protein
MCCRRCGRDGIFDVACTTATKVYRRKECRECRTISRRQHARLLSENLAPPEACQCCKNVTRLVLDHCHVTGSLRGYLCEPCNRGIGMLGDTEASLQRAMRYLVQPRIKVVLAL